jgi:hypothetical protein
VVVAFNINHYLPSQPERIVYTAYMAEGETVWSLGCTHLHQSIRAAQKCFPKLCREWEVWGALPRVPVTTIGRGSVEMRLGATARRMTPLDLGSAICLVVAS